MEVKGRHYNSIWTEPGESGQWPKVNIIDQTRLPYHFEIIELKSMQDAERAICDMQVRGAPLIGATGAFGLFLALKENASDSSLEQAYQQLLASRPTAVNLRWALDRAKDTLQGLSGEERVKAALRLAQDICQADIEMCSSIGDHGLKIIQSIQANKAPGEAINILTHCNAGWLATVDWGTALAPMYKAHAANIPIHIWVDETRPRNQGAFLTSWELDKQGIAHSVIVDNAGGHLMQHGLVDLCIVGTDRTTRSGDVCNKIGTYLKALAAKDNGVPFYVAAPSPSIDWTISDGVADIPIEQRSRIEVAQITGLNESGQPRSVQIVPDHIQVRNDAFDTTPARFITGLITERGLVEANEVALAKLFPEFF